MPSRKREEKKISFPIPFLHDPSKIIPKKNSKIKLKKKVILASILAKPS